ncbi:MAG TPA: DUF4336 domain-containing protein [Candidatus Didemnitutus sp.]|nr:DUF4336 domain-containing protein [Candidatus Didemnitutus sp.]
MALLAPLHPDLWVCRVPYRALGLAIGRQLVAVRLPRGGLWIHSPIPVTNELRRELAELGEVRHVVGPNCYHDECLREFQQAYPHALFHAAPGLAKKKPDVRFGAELSDINVPHPDWAPVLEQHLVAGTPKLNEVVFFHRASRSLMLADLAFNFQPPAPFLTMLVLRVYGIWGKFAASRFLRRLVVNPTATRASLDRILAWDFDRIIVGHGDNIETGGKRVFREAFSFLR